MRTRMEDEEWPVLSSKRGPNHEEGWKNLKNQPGQAYLVQDWDMQALGTSRRQKTQGHPTLKVVCGEHQS